MCILHNIASSFHCHMCWLEFKMPLPPVKKQKTRACVREKQVHKLWTNVYSQKRWQLWLWVWAREHNNNTNISLHYPSIVPALQSQVLPCFLCRHYLVEVLEVELLVDGVSAVHVGPAGFDEGCQGCIALLFGKFCSLCLWGLATEYSVRLTSECK